MESIRIKDKQFRLYLPAEQIAHRVAEMARAIDQDYTERRPLMLVILNGAFVFAADLIRAMQCHPEVQFVRITTYGNTMTSSETAQVLLGLEIEVEGRDVMVVEDIVDTGFTTDFFISHLKSQDPRSVRLATFLFKPDNFKAGPKPDYIGYAIPPEFVVGYGMDYAQQGRELPGIYTLDEG